MKLSAPKKSTFCLAVILLIVGVVAHFVNIPFVSAYQYWVVVVSAVVLALGCYLKGF